MLEKLYHIARFAHRGKAWILSLFVFFVAVTAYSLLLADTDRQSHLLVPAILGGIWSLLLYTCGELFLHVPARPQADVGFFKKLKIRLVLLAYSLLALAMILTTMALLWLSFRLMVL